MDAIVPQAGAMFFGCCAGGAASRFNLMIAAQGNWPDMSDWRRWFPNQCRFQVIRRGATPTFAYCEQLRST